MPSAPSLLWALCECDRPAAGSLLSQRLLKREHLLAERYQNPASAMPSPAARQAATATRRPVREEQGGWRSPPVAMVGGREFSLSPVSMGGSARGDGHRGSLARGSPSPRGTRSSTRGGDSGGVQSGGGGGGGGGRRRPERSVRHERSPRWTLRDGAPIGPHDTHQAPSCWRDAVRWAWISSLRLPEPEMLSERLRVGQPHVDAEEAAEVAAEVAAEAAAVEQEQADSDLLDALAGTSDTAAADGTQMPDKEARRALFDAIETSGNGRLTSSEYITGIMRHMPAFTHKRSLKRAFRAADVDSNGVITRREFRLALQHSIFFHQLIDVFDRIDSNGDGRLDEQEFIEACRSIKPLASDADGGGGQGRAREEGLRASFRRVDSDRSGFISMGELCSWAARQHASNARRAGAHESMVERSQQRRRDQQSSSSSPPPPPSSSSPGSRTRRRKAATPQHHRGGFTHGKHGLAWEHHKGKEGADSFYEVVGSASTVRCPMPVSHPVQVAVLGWGQAADAAPVFVLVTKLRSRGHVPGQVPPAEIARGVHRPPSAHAASFRSVRCAIVIPAVPHPETPQPGGHTTHQPRDPALRQGTKRFDSPELREARQMPGVGSYEHEQISRATAASSGHADGARAAVLDMRAHTRPQSTSQRRSEAARLRAVHDSPRSLERALQARHSGGARGTRRTWVRPQRLFWLPPPTAFLAPPPPTAFWATLQASPLRLPVPPDVKSWRSLRRWTSMRRARPRVCWTPCTTPLTPITSWGGGSRARRCKARSGAYRDHQKPSLRPPPPGRSPRPRRRRLLHTPPNLTKMPRPTDNTRGASAGARWWAHVQALPRARARAGEGGGGARPRHPPRPRLDHQGKRALPQAW
jgi:Ca2+-binding EF-hand superfamily protein